MAFTVAIGSGVAIIPCGNTTVTPYTRLLLPHLASTRTRRSLHVARAKKLSSESHPFSTATEPQDTAEVEEPLDDAVSTYQWPDLPGQEPDFWEGPQWDWLGTFVQYSWILGFAVAAILALLGCFTHHEPPKKLKEAAANKYSVQSSEVFEEPDAYDSDVFDSNPTEVAPSLE
ncbi:hypothetical protein E2542_SST30977 [Spatholobus suberectus]|nr:hypothetical protein E2542_SST30977 [Spatholobus suberectus]